MACTETGQGIANLRDQVFRLIDSLAQEAPPGEQTSEEIEAAIKLQSAAYLLGEAERSLGHEELRVVGSGWTAA